MIRWRSGTVVAVVDEWRGVVVLDVTLDRRDPEDPDRVPALAYPSLVGEPRPGDRVVLNLNAWSLGLGTGGYAFVVAVPDRLPADREAPGHAVKARYTPLQAVVLATDEPASPYRLTLATADDLGGMPVVTADLHSALPAVVAGIHATRTTAKVAYVMTDGGALPAWFSRTVASLGDHLVGTVSTGQAFGGDLEAATVHSALLAARHALDADIAVVAPGPGSLGTGSTWGFAGVAVGETVNAVAVLGGRAVGSIRCSMADPRPRHRGVSQHSLVAYGRVALAPADLVLPSGCPPSVTEAVRGLCPPHRLVQVPVDGLEALLRALPAPVTSMGRGLDEDPLYFLTAAAAGRHAALLV